MHGLAQNQNLNDPEPQSRMSLALPIATLWLLLFSSVLPAQEAPVAFDAKRSFEYLKQVCDLGPRVSGTEGMAQQQELIIKHFSQFGCAMSSQAFDVQHPQNGTPVRMTNLIVSWQPNAKERILVCCHYDTRPFPDQDRDKPRGRFIGANDGASGVALFMELAHHMKTIKPRYGIDFVFFDGEELVYRPSDKYFHGSEYFARWISQTPPNYRYVAGVLVDLIGDKSLNLPIEKNSLQMAPKVTRSIWATAKRLGVKEFIDKPKHEVNDDHIPLNKIARIPTCDIIDFDYFAWHKTTDLPSACSGESLEKVGRVLLTWFVDPQLE